MPPCMWWKILICGLNLVSCLSFCLLWAQGCYIITWYRYYLYVVSYDSLTVIFIQYASSLHQIWPSTCTVTVTLHIEFCHFNFRPSLSNDAFLKKKKAMYLQQVAFNNGDVSVKLIWSCYTLDWHYYTRYWPQDMHDVSYTVTQHTLQISDQGLICDRENGATK